MAFSPAADQIRLNDANRLGPTFLQLGPTFDRRQFESLHRYLEALPRELPFVVEVRHHDYFDNGPIERSPRRTLESAPDRPKPLRQPSLVLHAARRRAEIEVQRSKPHPPLHRTLTGRHQLLRLIGRDNLDLVKSWVDDRDPIVDKRQHTGLSPFVFTRSPKRLIDADLR